MSTLYVISHSNNLWFFVPRVCAIGMHNVGLTAEFGNLNAASSHSLHSLIDPLGLFTITVSFQNFRKQNNIQMKIVITTGGIIGLTEGIIDDTCLLFYYIIVCLKDFFLQVSSSFSKPIQVYLQLCFETSIPIYIFGYHVSVWKKLNI